MHSISKNGCTISIFYNVIVAICCLLIQTSASSVVTIIGSTGTLGRSLVLRFAASTAKVFASYRDENGAKQLLQRLINSKFHNRPTLFEYNLQDYLDRDIPGFGYCSPYNHHILINSAGICMKGNSLLSMKENININFHQTIRATNNVLKQYSKIQRYDENNSLTIINISSGDGERCYIHTKIADEITNIHNLDDLHKYSNNLIINYDSSFEYAYGESPMYSLSKALLNRYIELMHLNIMKSTNKDNIINNDGDNLNNNNIIKNNNIYLFACCPGNIISPMSTDEEILTSIPVEVAANHIYQLATNPKQYQNGRFYRNSELLNW